MEGIYNIELDLCIYDFICQYEKDVYKNMDASGGEGGTMGAG